MWAEQAAERHREVAGRFAALTTRVSDFGERGWDAPAPVEGWTARDVVGHLVGWFPGFLAAGSGIVLEEGPSVGDDPVEAWRVHAQSVQDVLDDPATAGRRFSNPHTGELPLADAISQFYTTDVFLHSWDLATATGQEAALDPEVCALLLAGMEPIEQLLRASGQYGPRVEVAPDADPQSRLIAFIGRDPAWRPPA